MTLAIKLQVIVFYHISIKKLSKTTLAANRNMHSAFAAALLRSLTAITRLTIQDLSGRPDLGD